MPTSEKLVSLQKESRNEELDIEIQQHEILAVTNTSSGHQQKCHVTVQHPFLAPSQEESAGALCAWVTSVPLTTNLTPFSGLELVFTDVLI